MKHAGKMYSKLIDKNDIMIATPVLCSVETRGCCSLETGQLHGKKKDQEQVELRELYSPASTGPRYSDLQDTG